MPGGCALSLPRAEPPRKANPIAFPGVKGIGGEEKDTPHHLHPPNQEGTAWGLQLRVEKAKGAPPERPF